jgi:hypothetical protein
MPHLPASAVLFRDRPGELLTQKADRSGCIFFTEEEIKLCPGMF